MTKKTPHNRNRQSTNDSLCSMNLIITGKDLEPGHISNILNLQPTQCWRRGEIKVLPTREHVYTNGGWKLVEPSQIQKRPAQEQLEFWCQLLSNKQAGLTAIAREGHHIELNCYVSSETTACLMLTPQVLADLASSCVNVSVNFFAYFPV